ncbi:hypothetical protein GCM10009780_48830 [Actinomadura alba]
MTAEVGDDSPPECKGPAMLMRARLPGRLYGGTDRPESGYYGGSCTLGGQVP